MTRDLLALLILLSILGLGSRFLRPAPLPPPPGPRESLGLGGVRPGDSFESVTQRYGRLDSTTRTDGPADVWRVCHYGPFQELSFALQPSSNDLWLVSRVIGGPLTQGNITVAQPGDSQEQVQARVGPPHHREPGRWVYALEPSRPLRVYGRSPQPRLYLEWQHEKLQRAWLDTYQVPP